MGKKERLAYLQAILGRYATATRLEKQAILNEFCLVCNYNRKYATLIHAQNQQHKKEGWAKMYLQQ